MSQSGAQIKKMIILMMLTAACSLFAHAEDAASEAGFKNDSEAGVVVTSGNTKTQTYNLKQMNSYGFVGNLFKFEGRYLKSSNKGVESARNWGLGLRYERELSQIVSAFLAETLDSDLFAGFFQKYNTDLGAKFKVISEKNFSWNAEAGYRYTKENRTSGESKSFNYARLYTEAVKNFNETVSAKFWLEYLPNLTESKNSQINSELSVSAVLTSVFSVKSAYLVKFNNEPNPGISEKTDSTFTTSLVAKF